MRSVLRAASVLSAMFLFFASEGWALITVGALDTPGSARDVEVVGNLAYVADEGSGLRVIDVSDPAHPVEIGALDTPGNARDVEVAGDRAYVADYGSGLRVIDVSNPALPVELGGLDTPVFAFSVDVVGSLAYVADQASGLRVIDVSNPALPVEIGALDVPGGAVDVEVVGGLAYVADGGTRLRVIDISDPALPVEIGSVDMPAYNVANAALAVEGDRAYMAQAVAYPGYRPVVERLLAIDISDPTLPVEIGHYGGADSYPSLGGGSYSDIEAAGDLVYATVGSRGLWVFDFSEPAAPLELIDVDTPGKASSDEVVGTRVYVTDGQSGLRVMEFGPEYSATIAAEVDIRPWSARNVIDPFGKAPTPVALLTSDTLAVADVDLTTLAFGPAAAKPVFDLTDPTVLALSQWDVNGDGKKDLISYYRPVETGIVTGDSEACLTGQTQEGTPFEGCDAIETLPACGHGFEAALVLPPLAWIGGRMRRRPRA